MAEEPTSAWERLKALYDETARRPVDQREAYLAEHAPDAETAREVRELLEQGPEDDFLVSPFASPTPGDLPGFRLGRVLGSGGMGTVYEAEQESPRRTVALKLLRPLAVGPAAKRRFAAEAETLARLQHPNIAQVYAAGTHEVAGAASPWFALELVPGAAPLTLYAVRHGLAMEQRLRLFLQVCAGVQHAHERGVVHRDLKPGNVLVGESGQPKVIDFGVAQAAGDNLQRTTQHTSAGELLGTLGYMSPEQCAGEPSAIDARTDVYALGVMLYELTTGRLPYAVVGLPLPAALRTITEAPPARARELPIDLEAILLRALEKDRSRRYASVAELAADLHRFLEKEPVTARPPTFTYHLRLLARRHRALFAGAAIAFAALVVATGISTWFALEAGAQAEVAAEQRDAAEETLAILTGALRAANPFLEPRTVTVAELLDGAAQRLQGDAVQNPGVRLRLHTALGSAYRGLGRSKEARTHLEQARSLAAGLPGVAHTERISIATLLAAACSDGGDHIAAIAAMHEAIALAKDTRPGAPGDLVAHLARLGGYQTRAGQIEAAAGSLQQAVELGRGAAVSPVHLAEALANLGTLQWRRADHESAARNWELALEQFGRSLAPDHPIAVQTRSNYGLYLQDRGRYAEAETMFTTARDTLARLRGPESADVANGEMKLGFLFVAMQQFVRAEAAFVHAIELRRKLFPDDSVEVPNALEGLAYLQLQREQWQAAAATLVEALALRRKKTAADDPDSASTRLLLGRALLGAGDAAAAEPHLRAAVTVRTSAFGPENFRVATARSALGECLFRLGLRAEAEPLLRQAVPVLVAKLGETHAETVAGKRRLAAFEAAAGEVR